MSEGPKPNGKKFSLMESVARVFCVSIILAIIVNVVYGSNVCLND